ncbi:hypothetical protein FUAX_55850 (plasmid) [Fulvitalea axinellae]|uniref:Uncharacterized protein n=1 Tax=Fulvitalea axinellae TaxID=1182444 RepID=A0AAU9CSS7_9BACT|nr:hypothetical protein FUAX_55850 [Fulvitalea axinellae]
MTLEEIQDYIAEHPADRVEKCPVSGRWERREWDLEDGRKIVEENTYDYPPEHEDAYLGKKTNYTVS